MKAYLLDIGQLHNEEIFTAGLVLVDEKRKEKIEMLRNEAGKKSSLGAGLLMQYAFAQSQKSHLLKEIEFGGKGKPYLPNQEFQFNLSHSGERVLCVTGENNIGCDVEKIRNSIPKHLNKILSISELEYITTMSDEDKISYFFRLWTIKESMGKYYGSGLAFPFHEVTVMEKNDVLSYVKYRDDTLYLHSFAKDDYILGICSQNEYFGKTMKNLEISDVL